MALISRYQELCAQFYDNRLLFGDRLDDGVVAVEIASRNQIEVIRRIKGKLSSERRPLRLFALVADRELVRRVHAASRVVELQGDFSLRFLLSFDSLDSLDA